MFFAPAYLIPHVFVALFTLFLLKEQKMDDTARILWVMLIILVPFLGAAAFFIMHPAAFATLYLQICMRIKKMPVTGSIMLLCIIGFVLSLLIGNKIELFLLSPKKVWEGHVYLLFTYAFFSNGFFHLSYSLISLFIIGFLIEPRVHKAQTILIAITGILVTGITYCALNFHSDSAAIGVSSVISALAGVYIVFLIKKRKEITVFEKTIGTLYVVFILIGLLLSEINTPITVLLRGEAVIIGSIAGVFISSWNMHIYRQKSDISADTDTDTDTLPSRRHGDL